MDKTRAALFDAYGTLYDDYSVGLLAERLFPGQDTTSNNGDHYRRSAV